MSKIDNLSLNNNYTLQKDRIDTLIGTLIACVTNPNWYNGVLAVRLDFSVSNQQNLLQDVPTIDVYECFDVFLNRLRRKQANGSKLHYMANWKKEYSRKKGKHIHTVFYFDHNQVTSCAPTSILFELLRDLWERCSYNPTLNQSGFINIVPAYLCESKSSFRAQPYSSEECYSQPHFHTILVNNTETLAGLSEYDQQKHLKEHPCGIIHWISYLAKQEQAAPVKKAFGTVSNAIN